MAGFGRDPAVQRLADLADRHQFVDPAVPQRAEQLLPRRRQRRTSAPETLQERRPRNPCPDCLWPGLGLADRPIRAEPAAAAKDETTEL